MKRDVFTKLNELASFALNLANFIDEKGIENEEPEFLNNFGIGWGVASRILRDGASAIGEIQGMYYNALFYRQLAEIGEKEADDFVEDVFGDREASNVNDEIKGKLREALVRFYDEWEEEHPV